MKRIRFQDTAYLFVGDNLADGGAIALEDDFKAGRCSYAHLYPDGCISRFGEHIGNVSDITVEADAVTVKPDDPVEAIVNCFVDETWPFNRADPPSGGDA